MDIHHRITGEVYFVTDDAQGIYLNDYFNQKLNYIHKNPVKAESVNRQEYYRYSSAIDWAGGKGLLEVSFV